MYTVESSRDIHASLLSSPGLISYILWGIIILIIYLPVHKGSGLKIAGIGNYPFQSRINIDKIMTCYLVKNVSLRVNRQEPSKESYTIPITGLLALGVTIYLGT